MVCILTVQTISGFFLMSKRSADKQITKDNPVESDGGSGSEIATVREKATEEVIATRKIISVRRGGSAPAAPQQKSDTPPLNEVAKSPKSKTGGLFSGLSGLSARPTISAATPVKTVPSTGPLSSISEKPSEEKPKFELFSKPDDAVVSGGLFSSLFAPAETSTFAGFSTFGAQESGESREQSPEESASEEEPEPAVVSQDHGDDEELLFQGDCKLFKLVREESVLKWTEKGIGFVRLIRGTDTRIVVRMKGVLRLMLSAGLVPAVAQVERVGNKSVKFTCLDGDALGQFRLNLLTEDQQAGFVKALDASLCK